MHIYKFTHTETGRCYIGQTIQQPNQRRLEHISESRHTDKNYHFHNALKKYGIDSFKFEVIDSSATTLEELNRLEEKYVEQYNSISNGFNIRNPGDNKTHNPESIERMRIAQRAAHARRREQNGGVEKHSATRSHKGKSGLWALSEDQKKKHSKLMSEINKKTSGGKTWKIINGKRTWLNKEASV
jgi:group I intron endonuclease